MDRFFAYSLEEIPLVALTLIIAFTAHELAHAYTAYKFGDPTAKDQGRLTLNPIAHLDPIGTILIFVVGFGWARPVPVNRFYFKNPRVAGVVVSLMGPISNFILAFIGFGVLFMLGNSGLGASTPPIVTQFLEVFVWLNLVLFVFNLLPIPPLDGYRVIEDIVPPHMRAKMTHYEQYGTLIFLILVITPLSQYTIRPIFQTVMPFLMTGFRNFFALFL